MDAAFAAARVGVRFRDVHGAAMKVVPGLLESGMRVVDLSADFRLKDADVFRRWYGEHPAPELLADSVYGIPEFARERLRSAKIVAVPGCYPTGALFGVVPLARAGVVAASTRPLPPSSSNSRMASRFAVRNAS